MALCQVLDILKWQNEVGAVDRLRRAIQTHLRSRLATYGVARFQPKCHFSIHLPSLLARDRLLSCWVHERKHKELKRFASDSHNANLSNAFEKGLIKQVVLAQLNSLKDLDIGDHSRLFRPVDAPDAVMGHVRSFLRVPLFVPLIAKSSKEVFLDGVSKCSASDVILATVDGEERVGQVWLFVSALDRLLVFWSPWNTLGNNRFNLRDDPQIMDSSCIKRCCVYQLETPQTALVVP